jgi:hypothetical protein
MGIDTSAIQAELTTVGIADIRLDSSGQVVDATTTSKEEYLDVVFLAAADKIRCGKLLHYLENDHTKGRNN